MWKFVAGFAVAFWIALPDAARAEMGKAPSGSNGIYASIFGGYIHSDGPDTLGHTVVPGTNVFFAVDDGGFVGGSLGYVIGSETPSGFLGLSNVRVEASFSGLFFADDNGSAPLGNLARLDGVNAAAVPVDTEQEREVYDGSLAVKGDVHLSGAVSVTTGLEIFCATVAMKHSRRVPALFVRWILMVCFSAGCSSFSRRSRSTKEFRWSETLRRAYTKSMSMVIFRYSA